MEAKIARPDSSNLITWVQHTAYLHAARVFVEACGVARIPVMPVKGLVTAYTLYDDPLDRAQPNDIDFRITPENFPRLEALALARGWTVVDISRAYRTFAFRIHGVEVDVETTIGPPHVSSLRVESVIKRARSTNALGFTTLFPDFLDHTVLLVINVFKDKLTLAMPWALRDVERLAAHREFDPVKVVAALREARLATIGWIVADMMATERDCRRWGEVRDGLAPFARQSYAQLMKQLARRPAALSTRIVARCGGDDRWSALPAVLSMLRWRLERLRP